MGMYFDLKIRQIPDNTLKKLHFPREMRSVRLEVRIRVNEWL